ncbi:hypothetical protein B0A53_03359 [Rhodotorula sp. CCFEE 5036]|nr:hypothetical protein B0A53_03359 [Rhodotorula sp. CCFEE 5036]
MARSVSPTGSVHSFLDSDPYPSAARRSHPTPPRSHSTASAITPTSLLDRLESHLRAKAEEVQLAGQLGQALLAQQQELEARIREIAEVSNRYAAAAAATESSGGESSDEREVGEETKKSLQLLEEELARWEGANSDLYQVVGTAAARGVPPITGAAAEDASSHDDADRNGAIHRPRAPSLSRKGSHANLSASSSSHSLADDSINLPTSINTASQSRRSRNAAAQHRTNDIELATEIGQSLLVEVRRLQALLQERDDKLKSLEKERDEKEAEVENALQARRAVEDEFEKYKEVNWELELASQDLRSSLSAAQSALQKAEQDRARHARDLASTRDQLDSQRLESERLAKDLDELKNKHETDMANMRKSHAGLQRDKSDLQGTLEGLKSELAARSRAIRRGPGGSPAPGTPGYRRGLPGHGDDEDGDGSSGEGDFFLRSTARRRTGEGFPSSAIGKDDLFGPGEGDSPSASPIQRAGFATEADSLRASLAHAQRQIQTLRTSLQREKQAKLELRRQLGGGAAGKDGRGDKVWGDDPLDGTDSEEEEDVDEIDGLALGHAVAPGDAGHVTESDPELDDHAFPSTTRARTPANGHLASPGWPRSARGSARGRRGGARIQSRVPSRLARAFGSPDSATTEEDSVEAGDSRSPTAHILSAGAADISADGASIFDHQFLAPTTDVNITDEDESFGGGESPLRRHRGVSVETEGSSAEPGESLADAFGDAGDRSRRHDRKGSLGSLASFLTDRKRRSRSESVAAVAEADEVAEAAAAASQHAVPVDWSDKATSTDFVEPEVRVERVEVPVPFEVIREVQVEKRVEVPVEVVREVTVEKIVEVPVDRIVEVEKRVEVPIDRIVEVPVDRLVEVEKRVEVPVDVVREVTVEKIVEVPVDRIVDVEKRVEVPVDRIVEVEKRVDVPFEVIKEIEKRVEVPVEVIREVIKEVPVEVERRVEVPVDRIVEVQVDRIVEVEKRVEVPVEVVREVEKRVEVEKVVEVPVDRIVEVEKRVEVPVEVVRTVEVEKRVEVPVDVERRVEVPVEKVVERIVEVPVEVIKTVEVEKIKTVEVPVEKIVERIVEKPVEVIREVERRVEVPVDRIVEVPVDRVVEKIVEKRIEVPVETIREVEKRVEVPVEVIKEVTVEVEKRVEVPVDRIVEVEKRVEVPVDRIVEVPVDRIVEVERRVEVPVDRIVEIQVDRIVEVEKRVEVPVDRIVEVPVDRIVEVERRVEVPVDRIVEVAVDRIVEVEKRVEVPVEVVREVEVEKVVERLVPAPALPCEACAAAALNPPTPIASSAARMEDRALANQPSLSELTAPIQAGDRDRTISSFAALQGLRSTPSEYSEDDARSDTTGRDPASRQTYYTDVETEYEDARESLGGAASSVGAPSFANGPRPSYPDSMHTRSTSLTDFVSVRSGRTTPFGDESDSDAEVLASREFQVDEEETQAFRRTLRGQAAQWQAAEAARTEGNEPEVRTVYVDKVVYVDKPVEVEKVVYVDRVVEVEKLVEVPVERVVERVVEVEVEKVVEKVVEKIVYVDRPVAAPSVHSKAPQVNSEGDELHEAVRTATAYLEEPESRPVTPSPSVPDLKGKELMGPPPLPSARKTASPRKSGTSSISSRRSTRHRDRASQPQPPSRPTSPPPADLLFRAQSPTFDDEYSRRSTLLAPPVASVADAPKLRSHASTLSAISQAEAPFTSLTADARPHTSLGIAATPRSLRFSRQQASQTSFRSMSDLSTEGPGARRMSMASEATSEGGYDAPEGARPAMGRAPGDSTDPQVIHAITQTMIGEFMHKYTRRKFGKELSENRHQRFFWLHPYTRTLYWSASDPGASTTSHAFSKSAYIEGVRQVLDPNPLPSGLHQHSIVIRTREREVKFTASTRERHDMWFAAIRYLIERPEGSSGPADPSVEVSQSPKTPIARTGTTRTRSKTLTGGDGPSDFFGIPDQIYTFGTASASDSRLTPKALPRWVPHGRNTVNGATASRPGTAAADYHRHSGSASLRSVSTYGEFGEGSLEVVDRDEIPAGLDGDADEFEGLENVRACCNGKHDVGSLSRRNRHSHHRHHHSSLSDLGARPSSSAPTTPGRARNKVSTNTLSSLSRKMSGLATPRKSASFSSKSATQDSQPATATSARPFAALPVNGATVSRR